MNNTIKSDAKILQRTSNTKPLMFPSLESHDISNFECVWYWDTDVKRFFENNLISDQVLTEPSSPGMWDLQLLWSCLWICQIPTYQTNKIKNHHWQNWWLSVTREETSNSINYMFVKKNNNLRLVPGMAYSCVEKRAKSKVRKC